MNGRGAEPRPLTQQEQDEKNEAWARCLFARVKEFRDEQGLSTAALARQMGVSPRTLQRAIRGVPKMPSVPTIASSLILLGTAQKRRGK